ncbi:MAG: ATP-dependent nuclease [Nocardioidaceae bacterium]
MTPIDSAAAAADTAPSDAAAGALRLFQLTVGNFRTIGQPQTAKLIADLTVLVGANGTGKTTVLDAISCLLEGNSVDGGNEASVIEGCFLDESQQQVRVRARFDGGKWQREVATLVHPGLGKAPEKATAADLKTFLGTTGLKEELVSKAREYIATLPASELEEAWSPLGPEVVPRLPRLVRFDAETAVDPHAEIETLTQREFQRLVHREEYANLADRLGKLFQHDIADTMNSVNETVTRHCGEMVNDVTASASIEFSKIKPTVDVRTNAQGNDLSAAHLSLGQRRRMGLAVNEALTQVLRASDADGWDLVVYDEPDTHLDFFAQRRLADVLREQAGVAMTQVVVATHAPRLIDQARPQALVHLRLEDGNSVVENLADVMNVAGDGDDPETDLLIRLDQSLGNSALLAERCIVIVEGSSDTAVLRELYRLRYGVSPRNDGVVIIDHDGCARAMQLARIVIERWRRMVILALDSDQERDPTLRALREQCATHVDVHLLGERELEDCFSDESWATALTAYAEHGDPWSTDDIADLRRTAREENKGLSKVIKKACTERSLRASKPDLARAVALHSSPEDQDQALVELLTSINRAGRE